MQAWFVFECARARCIDLRVEAARLRLARYALGAPRGAGRRRIARALRAVGALIVDAGDRLGGDVSLAR